MCYTRNIDCVKWIALILIWVSASLAGTATAQTPGTYQGTTAQGLPVEFSVSAAGTITAYSGKFRCDRASGMFRRSENPGCRINNAGRFNCGAQSSRCDAETVLNINGLFRGSTLRGKFRVRTGRVMVNGETVRECCLVEVGFEARRNTGGGGGVEGPFTDSFE